MALQLLLNGVLLEAETFTAREWVPCLSRATLQKYWGKVIPDKNFNFVFLRLCRRVDLVRISDGLGTQRLVLKGLADGNDCIRG